MNSELDSINWKLLLPLDHIVTGTPLDNFYIRNASNDFLPLSLSPSLELLCPSILFGFEPLGEYITPKT